MRITILPLQEMTPYGRQYGSMDENGVALATHFCSDDIFAICDLQNKRRKEQYSKLYPEGWYCVFSSEIYKNPSAPVGGGEEE